MAIVLAALAYFAVSYFDARNQLSQAPSGSNPAVNEDNIKNVTDEIAKYLELPNEKPAVATINDVNQVKDQEFFKNAQNGDMVFVFAESQRGLLYRPSTHKIIEYTKVDIAAPPQQSTTQ